MKAPRSDIDVLCLGAGPCGEALCAELSGSGLTVAVLEPHLVGGECPYWGCMPSKTMIRAGEVIAEGRRSLDMSASRVDIDVDFPKAARRTAWMARDWNDQGAAESLTGTGAELIRAAGRLTGERLVELESGDLLQARRAVVVATGSSPVVPEIPGLVREAAWTNREAVAASELPRSLLVIGGGAVGVELAQAFRRLGSEVTVLQVQERLVAAEEPEAGVALKAAFEAEGIVVHTGARLDGLPEHGSRDGSTRVLLATGRRPNLEGFDLGAAGAAATERGWLRADPATLEAAAGLFAGGDVTGIFGFTHVADYHGHVIGRRIKGENAVASHAAIPRVTFTDPEIASVGITEAQARERGMEVKIAFTEVPSTARGYIHDARFGFIKLVADLRAGGLAGATIVGPRAGELIGELTLAMRAQVPLQVLADTVHGFPTFARPLQWLFAELAAGRDAGGPGS